MEDVYVEKLVYYKGVILQLGAVPFILLLRYSFVVLILKQSKYGEEQEITEI